MRNRGQIRRGEASQASHGDDWLVTYADTITLLLCVFVVLLAMEAHKRESPPRPALSPPTTQAMEPIRFWDGKPPFPHMARPADPDDDGGAVDPAGDLPPDATGSATVTATLDEPSPVIFVPTSPASGWVGPATSRYWASNDPPAPAAGTSRRAAARPATEPDAAAPPATDADDVPLSDSTMPASPSLAAPITPGGDRITTLEFASTALFGSGSATLTGSGKAILLAMVEQLNASEYKAYRVTVEGHTDDAPINTAQFPSNWELSTARAATVVRFFVEQGIASQRLRAAGYADTRPLSPNRDPAGIALPDNQARNRRVAIVLEKIARDGIDIAAP